MTILNRRQLLVRLARSASQSAPAYVAPARGCLASDLNAATHGTFRVLQNLSSSTGDQFLDQTLPRLGRALVRLSQMFDERPSFGFFDGRGAFATSRTVGSEIGTYGTVAFGRALFRDLMTRYRDQGMSVMATMAHEFAHIAQFRSGANRRLEDAHSTVKYVELHADFLLGYYLGVRKMQEPSVKLWASGQSLFEIGDYEFNDPQHHGTPHERTAAAEAGFQLGQEDGVSFKEAFSEGMDVILSKF